MINSITTPRAWLMTLRPRTLGIPTIQVSIGTVLAYAVIGNVNWFITVGALIVAILITIGTNLVNDAIDFENGGDTLNRFGHQKMIQAGLLAKNEVLIAGLLSFAIASAIPFFLDVNGVITALVILSAICGYCYTGGPFPISYMGLSELFIFIFYGGVCVIATFYVQTKALTPTIFLAATQLGLLTIIPNALNNFRDIFEDAAINKRTLAVRFGKAFARKEIVFLTFLPFILNGIWFFLGFMWAALLPLLMLPIAFLFVRSIWLTDPGPVFNRYFGLSVLMHFFFGVLLSIGLLLN